jgi:ribonucleoside-diphosphate reductase alpha chain
MEMETAFASELSWKIFLDRYTMKDPERRFNVGDLAVVLVDPHPKWPKKDIGRVRAVLPDGRLELELLTGPDKGQVIERRVLDCDRPLETTLAQVARRIADGVAAVEDEKVRTDVADLFADELAHLRFVPGGRIWAGAGTGQQLTFYNCYVIPCPHDSREGIVQTLGQMIEIMSRGGGVGINVSSLRPARAAVRGVNGRSSGAVSWMDLYSRATGLVEQGGSRRGALMLQLEDWHPDIWRFIEVKKTPGMVENANISVRISDRFMEAVKQDGDWELVFPDTTDPDYDRLWDGNLEQWQALGKPVVVYERTKARKIWQAIIQGAWEAAEPGVVFDERHEKESNSWYFNPLVCTNPCVTGDTLVYTDQGLRRARDLYASGQPTAVLVDGRFGGDALAPASAVFLTGIKPVVRVRTVEGYSVRVTPDHLLFSDRRGWVRADALEPGEPIRIVNRGGAFGREGSAEEGRLLGWLLADRQRARKRETPADGAPLPPTVRQGEPALLAARAEGRIGPGSTAGAAAPVVAAAPPAAADPADPDAPVHIPEVVWRGNRAMQAGFLAALFDADGVVQGGPAEPPAVRLPATGRDLLEDVQRLLLNFGVFSRIEAGEADRAGTPDPVLVVTGRSLMRFAHTVGLLDPAKRRRLRAALEHQRGPYGEAWVAVVASVEPDGVEPVYDLTEPRTHSFVANGIVVHNCAEQPLPAWGVCTLGHINLAAFYDPDSHDVRWDALRRTIRMGVRFLDDIIDATPYFFEENRQNQLAERRIGMGTMGLGELLIRLGLRYGSAESVRFIDRLYRFIATEAYLYDTELAREKGPFPRFDAEKYLQSGFMQRMPAEVREAVRQYGTRNVTILTQAPTGTVGTMVGTSTGIEPFYALTYYRQSRLGFDAQYVPVAQEWLDKHPGQPLPDYFVGAMDLTPEEHIYVQAAIQRWTDSSISKTANAPASYTVEDTARLYELAYELGCKGVTIYRDQSRHEQVLHTKETAREAEAKPAAAPDRAEAPRREFPANVEVYPVPSQVSGRTYRKETPAGTARVVINEVDADPFEVFLLLGRAGSEVQSFMEALGRVISLYLRSSGDLSPRRRLELVAEQLKGIGGANQMGFGPDRVLSVVDAIGLVLERHLHPEKNGHGPGDPQVPAAILRSGRSAPKLDLCPQCNAPTLVYEEGCAHCLSCGYSKC